MVKQGYKQTEVGVIPEDWIFMPAGEFIEVLTDFTANGSFASLAENVTYLDYPDYARLVRLTDIRTNFKNRGVYVSKDSYEFLAKSSLYGGELLLANVGAYAGYSFLFQKNFQENATLGPNMFLIKANKNILREEYVPLVFGYGSVFKQLIDAAASSAQPKINKENVRKSVAIIPPLDEQKRIAEALSDVDSMISSLEKLIAKKKSVKQGAMQELLTGKKRLPGFDGEWRSILLEDVCVFYNGGTPSKKRSDWWNGCIPWISSSDLCENSITSVSINRYITQDALDHSATRLCPKNAVSIVSRVGVGKVAVTPCELCTSQDFTTIVSSAHNPYFLAYMLVPIMKDMAMQAQGTSIKGVTVEDIAKIKISTPSIKEQNQIVSILSDMDNEIEALEQKLEKTRQIKQGMIQQLLTGKIRLM